MRVDTIAMAEKWRRGNMGSKSLVFNQDLGPITPRFVVTTRPRFSSLLEVNGEAKPLHTYNKIEKRHPWLGAMGFLHFLR